MYGAMRCLARIREREAELGRMAITYSSRYAKERRASRPGQYR